MVEINFMLFANNFTSDQIENCFGVCNATLHVKEKFNSLMQKDRTGTEMFFKWFMMLSRDNQEAVCTWIRENYKK